MPSMLHEAIIQIFRGHPESIPQLLSDFLGVPVPAFTSVRVESADLTDIKPAEYRADLVVLLVDDRPVLAVVVEVQLSCDAEKRRTWPVYVVNLRARLGCPACLLVITPDEAVARWSAEPIEIGHPGFRLTPLVLGPTTLPVITDLESAVRAPEAAILSLMAHGKGEQGLAIARVVLKAADGLDDDRKFLYADISFLSVNDAARRALEEMVKGGYEYQSDFARKYFGQGRSEGRSEGRTEALLAVLEARGIEVTDSIRKLIAGCVDVDELDRWLRRAAVATNATEVFGGSPS